MSLEHKGMISVLKLATAPISAHNYSLREDDLKEVLNKAAIYFFCKRKLLKFTNIDHSNKNTLKFDITSADNANHVSCVLDISTYSNISFNSFSTDKTDKHEICIEFNSKEKKSFSPEDLLWKDCKLNIHKAGDISKLLSFDVLYVGETTKQGVANRLDSHHALLKIFMKEIFYENYDKSHGIFILAFENENLDAETHTDFPPKPVKLTDYKTSALDIEQAFINLFDKTYNEIKYKDFPDKNDLLVKGGYNTIIYQINDDIILTNNNIKFVGNSGDLLANSRSFLWIQNDNMTLFNPGRETLAKIKHKGQRVPYKEVPLEDNPCNE